MKAYGVAWIVATVFFLAGLETLSDYGINWDGPYHMVRGQAFAHFLLTGETSFGIRRNTPPFLTKPNEYISRYYFAGSDTGTHPAPAKLPARPLPRFDYEQIAGAKRISFYQDDAWNGKYFIDNDVAGHLPFISILSAISNRVFFQWLGWLGDIESYQLMYFLFSSLGVYIVARFAFDMTRSGWASLVAGLSLGLYPLFFGESHINMKDPIVTSFFAASVWSFWHWVRENKFRWFVVFVISISLGLGVKWNGIFLPVILILWLFTMRYTPEFRRWFKPAKLAVAGLLGGVAIFLFLVAIWPYAWRDPLRAIAALFPFYWQTGTGVSLQPSGFLIAGWNLYPLVLLLTQTPDIVLVLLVVGFWAIARSNNKNQRSVGYLAILWIIVSILRVMLPGMRTYGGLRQSMEILPGVALISGLGAEFLIRSVTKKIRKIIQGIITISFIILIGNLIRIHPNENVYFNSFAGGLAGAAKKNLIDWTLTYGNVYKQAVVWLNENAQRDANLAHLDGSMFAVSPLWLRPDISISPYHFSGFRQKGEYIMVLSNPLNPPVFAARYPARFLTPLHQVSVEGVPLVSIYKNDTSRVAETMREHLSVTKPIVESVRSTKGDFFQIDLDDTVSVTGIDVVGADRACLTTNYEFFGFYTAENEPVDLTKLFVLNERTYDENNHLTYSFPGEKARFIRIFPQNDASCFVRGTIEKVHYLDH